MQQEEARGPETDVLVLGGPLWPGQNGGGGVRAERLRFTPRSVRPPQGRPSGWSGPCRKAAKSQTRERRLAPSPELSDDQQPPPPQAGWGRAGAEMQAQADSPISWLPPQAGWGRQVQKCRLRPTAPYPGSRMSAVGAGTVINAIN